MQIYTGIFIHFILILFQIMQWQVPLRAADAVYECCGVQHLICCVINTRCRYCYCTYISDKLIKYL